MLFRVVNAHLGYKTKWYEKIENAIEEMIEFIDGFEDYHEDYYYNEDGETFEEFWTNDILNGANFLYVEKFEKGVDK